MRQEVRRQQHRAGPDQNDEVDDRDPQVRAEVRDGEAAAVRGRPISEAFSGSVDMHDSHSRRSCWRMKPQLASTKKNSAIGAGQRKRVAGRRRPQDQRDRRQDRRDQDLCAPVAPAAGGARRPRHAHVVIGHVVAPPEAKPDNFVGCVQYVAAASRSQYQRSNELARSCRPVILVGLDIPHAVASAADEYEEGPDCAPARRGAPAAADRSAVYRSYRPLLDALVSRGADAVSIEEARPRADRTGRSIRDVLINDSVVTEYELHARPRPTRTASAASTWSAIRSTRPRWPRSRCRWSCGTGCWASR